MAIGELRGLVAQLAIEEGINLTGYPGLWFFRSHGPSRPRKASARMVTFAAVLQGRKRVEFDGLVRAYGPGSYLFVTGERRYRSTIEDASPDRPYLSVALELAPEEIAAGLLELADAGQRFGDEPEDDAPAVVARLTPPLLGALTRVVASLSDPVSRRVIAPLARKELLVHLLRGPAGATLRRAASTDDGRIRRAVAFLDSHATERVTVERVARHVAMSPSHFAHRFRDVVRMSPMQYVKHVRLQQARVLMLGEGLGAAEAGAEVGYASPSHFARDFKGYFGAPPGRYVQQLRVADKGFAQSAG